MSARDELYAALSEGVKHAQLRQHHIDEYRAEVLREAAAALEADMERFFAVWTDEPRNSPYALGHKDASDELRRMAASSSGTAAGDKQPETSPWQRAVDGLNALVDADIPFHIEPDGHISNPFGDEHIEWDRAAERWHLTFDDEEGQR
ncbi:hypothetical protein ACGF3K_14260 [Streptomyces sp. NPDC047980]|uniref:hypothetical protein n=1 Tax=Streptomyces sp. NPDC047980 TaxID=3365494 RepID=UPI00371DC845